MHFQDSNQFIIDILHSQNLGESVYLVDEIIIDYYKLENNVIINKFPKVNIIFNKNKIVPYYISVGELSICYEGFDYIKISCQNIKFDICREVILEKYSNISIDKNDDMMQLDLIKNHETSINESNNFMKEELVKIQESLKDWIDNEVPEKDKELLMKEFDKGNFERKIRFGREITEALNPLIDSLNKLNFRNNDYYYMVFDKICMIIIIIFISVGVGLIIMICIYKFTQLKDDNNKANNQDI